MKRKYLIGILTVLVMSTAIVGAFMTGKTTVQADDKSSLSKEDKNFVKNNASELFKLIDKVETSVNGKSSTNTKNESLISTDNLNQLNINADNIKESKGYYGDKEYVLDDDKMLLEFNSDKKPITYIKKEKVTSDKMKEKKGINSTVKTKSIAENLIKELAPNSVLKFESKFENGYVDYTYARTFKEYLFDQDFTKIVVDSSNGEVVTVSQRFLSEEPNININILDDAAKKVAEKLLNKNDIKSSKLLIVNPNGQWTNSPKPTTETSSKLAYEIVFANKDTVWISAEDGSVLGGSRLNT